VKLVIIIAIAVVFGIGIGLSLNVSAEEGLIPSWIKNTALWWGEESISDDDFLNAMQFLVKEGILVIPEQGPQGDPGPTGSGGSDESISVGNPGVGRLSNDCNNSEDSTTNVFGGVILLSDGTVKIPSIAGGYIVDPSFGSLPAGGWHDIEGEYQLGIVPENCRNLGDAATSRVDFRACAVNNSGDVWCVDEVIINGVSFGNIPVWTFDANVLP